MVAGFEAGMVWAFLGGVMLDMLLPERALGATTLVLLVAIGIALLVARVTDPPRIIVIAGTAFVLSFLYQALLIALLALTAGIGIPSPGAHHAGHLRHRRRRHRRRDRVGDQVPHAPVRVRRADRLVRLVALIS